MNAVAIPTKLGVFTAMFSERGLVSLDFPEASRTTSPTRRAPALHPQLLRHWQQMTEAALQRILDGDAPGPLPPLDWSKATAFQRDVWAALLDIPQGHTMSYSQIAAAIGHPRAARAVGAACGANPIPVLVPCHRILAARGRLGGFTAGLDWKRRLLAGEGVLAEEAALFKSRPVDEIRRQTGP